jgi:dynein heavy chain, axonemal
MPIVTALRNPDLMEMHWNDIREMIGHNLDVNEEGFTLQSLLDLNVVQYMDDIVAKSVEASGQAKLRGQLQELKDQWATIQIVTVPHGPKDNVFIIAGIEDMYQYLDEGLATINMILGNRFVKVMRKEAEDLKKQLNTLSEAFDQWNEVQRQWRYLENIFGGGTIKQQLPHESKMFDAVNKYFLGLNSRCNKSPQALRFIKKEPNIVQKLIDQNRDLEEIQRGLEAYVQSKRVIFPRFFFLSFEDLISILSESENKEVISLHLKTLFDGIVALEFTPDEQVTKMYSKEKECVELTKSVKTR